MWGWRLRVVPTGRELVCGIFETDAGLEGRCGYRDDLLRSELCPDLLSARDIAANMKQAIVALGSIEEVPLQRERDGE